MSPGPEEQPLRLARLAHLLGHPVRVRIVEALNDGRRTSASALSLAHEDVNLTGWSYHLRTLHRAGALVLVADRPVRGALEHIYELAPGHWQELQDFIASIAPRTDPGESTSLQ